MSKTCCTIVFSFLVVLFLTASALAGSYDFEGTDPTDDVQDLEDNGNFTSEYPDLDITFAKVEEKGDNIVFTLQVVRRIIPNNSSIRYVFYIESVNTSESIEVFFKNPYKCYVYRSEPDYEPPLYVQVNCNYTLSDDNTTVTITAPKTAFSTVPTPWNVTAMAKITVNKFLDELILDLYVPPETNGGTTDGNGDTGDGTPGFEIIAVIVASLIAVILLRKQRPLR